VSESAPKSQVSLVLVTVLLAYLGQMTLNPVIAPLSREVGLKEWQVGFMISVAAVMVVLTSQFWGRRSQSWGRKPVLVAAWRSQPGRWRCSHFWPSWGCAASWSA
jgi:MFS family permease